MRHFIDTEFIEAPGVLDLISIGIVAEDGRELYAVSMEANYDMANDWVRENVIPMLPPHGAWSSRATIAAQVRAFITDVPEFWGYYADYDWVLFCWLFGAMVDLPAGWPMFCLDLRQTMHERGIARSQLPPDPDDAHHALADARWLRKAWSGVYRGNFMNEKASAGARVVEAKDALAKARGIVEQERARVRLAQAEAEFTVAARELAAVEGAVI